MTPGIFKELQAVIGMANETNKLVTGYQVTIDSRFQPPLDPKKMKLRAADQLTSQAHCFHLSTQVLYGSLRRTLNIKR